MSTISVEAHRLDAAGAMKRVFVLEDDPERVRWFRERLIGHDATFAESCRHADRFTGPYDVVCLDHDLGGRAMATHEDDGAAFAACVRDKLGASTVIIHSYNADGAKRIATVLDGACVYAPFRGPMFVQCLDAALEESPER